jgi:hypothetical protein
MGHDCRGIVTRNFEDTPCPVLSSLTSQLNHTGPLKNNNNNNNRAKDAGAAASHQTAEGNKPKLKLGRTNACAEIHLAE